MMAARWSCAQAPAEGAAYREHHRREAARLRSWGERATTPAMKARILEKPRSTNGERGKAHRQ